MQEGQFHVKQYSYVATYVMNEVLVIVGRMHIVHRAKTLLMKLNSYLISHGTSSLHNKLLHK